MPSFQSTPAKVDTGGGIARTTGPPSGGGSSGPTSVSPHAAHHFTPFAPFLSPSTMSTSKFDTEANEAKAEHAHLENPLHHKFNPTDVEIQHGDAALAASADHVVVSASDSQRICVRLSLFILPVAARAQRLTPASWEQRRTDFHILTVICLIYWLQVLDKNIIGSLLALLLLSTISRMLTWAVLSGYTAVLGLKTQLNLVGNQVGSLLLSSLTDKGI